MHKILIAVPTFENISPETFKSIYNLNIPENVEAHFEFVRGYDCAVARNKIVDIAVTGGYDYVLMVDSDIVVPHNALTYLLEQNDDIVLGSYPRKNEPSKSEVFLDLGPNFNSEYRIPIEDIKNSNLHRRLIKGGGFGCALIKTEVFKKLKYPYFKYVIYDVEKQFLSEDLYFCVSAKQAGYSIFLDTRVICGHIKHEILDVNASTK